MKDIALFILLKRNTMNEVTLREEEILRHFYSIYLDKEIISFDQALKYHEYNLTNIIKHVWWGKGSRQQLTSYDLKVITLIINEYFIEFALKDN